MMLESRHSSEQSRKNLCRGKTKGGQRHRQHMTSSFPGQKVQLQSQMDDDVIRISEKEESRITSQR